MRGGGAAAFGAAPPGGRARGRDRGDSRGDEREFFLAGSGRGLSGPLLLGVGGPRGAGGARICIWRARFQKGANLIKDGGHFSGALNFWAPLDAEGRAGPGVAGEGFHDDFVGKKRRELSALARAIWQLGCSLVTFTMQVQFELGRVREGAGPGGRYGDVADVYQEIWWASST